MRLRAYLKNNGIQFKWFASQIGMSENSFSQVTAGRVGLPLDYWEKVVELTQGKITIEDLFHDYMRIRKRIRKRKTDDKD